MTTDTLPCGTALLVRLESGLHPNRISMLIHMIQSYDRAGVLSVDDLSVVSPETLSALLFKPMTAKPRKGEPKST